MGQVAEFGPIYGDRDANDPVIEHVIKDVRLLRAAVSADGGQDRLAVRTGESDGAIEFHTWYEPSPTIAYSEGDPSIATAIDGGRP
jgi:hypothetical protein